MATDDRAHGHLWEAYYSRFSDFSEAKVRDGAHPRALLHPEPAAHAVVLGHGLAASPFMLMDTALHLHEKHGFDVYLPLLDKHGLKKPNGMKGVTLEAWKANMEFGLEAAAERCPTVSVGGVSTGAALAFFQAATHPVINGTLLLFSAALGLADGWLNGKTKQQLLQTPLGYIMDVPTPLVQDNPYAYAHVDLDGARELARLIDEIDELWPRFATSASFPIPVFAAHSSADDVTDQARVQDLSDLVKPNRLTLYQIEQQHQVGHAAIVFRTPIRSEHGEIVQPASPCFAAMVDHLDTFLAEHCATSP
ncbi:MAG: hypothetical protein RhofKO_23960 [Rhodothermales bacterium]